MEQNNNSGTGKTTEISLLFMMMDSRLKPIARLHKEVLLKRFCGCKLIKDLIKYYESTEDITERDLEELLSSNNIMGKNYENIINSYRSTKSLSESGIELLISQFKDLISADILNRVKEVKSPSKAMEIIREYNFEFKDPNRIKSKFKEYSLYDLDPKNINEEYGIPIKSSIDTINECFAIKGYIRHQLIAVVAPPGVGKSLFLMNEAMQFIKDGLKVCYIAMGDLTEADFATRCTSIVTNNTMSEVTKNLVDNMNRFKNTYGEKLKNFQVRYADAGSVTAEEVCDYIEGSGLLKDWVIIIDYDTNFKSSLDMYAKGEESYNCLVNLAKKTELVFVASQPKIQFYDSPIIPMAGAAESSRKQQIIDVMITIGKNPKSINKIGYINIAKVRRGGTTIAFPYMGNPDGRFIPITPAKYHALENSPDLKMVKDSGLNVSDEDLNDLQELMKKS